MNALSIIHETKIVPVVVIDDVEKAVPLANALLAGGINVMEVTFRTAAGAAAIEAVAKNCPGMLLGAGTIVNEQQCKQAIDKGAQYIVSPGFDREIVKYCVQQGIDVLPGCITATEIMATLEFGLNVLKFFPANTSGGLNAMKALTGPFPQISFIPSGGINVQNLKEYLEAPFIYAVGGSWMCNREDIAAGNFSKITELCQQALALLK
jgi:2-dehydro-3-deoxyphosphogluconate aldolase/(4S)-4-hydroxy-2-oxoglutarate aldolase